MQKCNKAKQYKYFKKQGAVGKTELYAYTALFTSTLKIKFSVPTRLVNSFVTQPSSL